MNPLQLKAKKVIKRLFHRGIAQSGGLRSASVVQGEFHVKQVLESVNNQSAAFILDFLYLLGNKRQGGEAAIPVQYTD